MSLQRLRAAQRFVESQKSFSNFDVLELVDTGSNGVVFKCRPRDRKLQGEWALKVVINYGVDASVIVSVAVQEHSCIASLPPHRNIVEVFGTIGPAAIPQAVFDLCPQLMKESSSRQEAVGILMQYYPQDLEVCLQKHQQDPSLSACEIFGMCLDVLLALRHLQRYRMLHFDVKLNNFLVEEDKTLVLADFGCAQQVAEEDWMIPFDPTKSNLGNSAHLAPEVLRAVERASREVDSSRGGAKGPSSSKLPCHKQLEFAAGVILFEILFLTGHPYGRYPANLADLFAPSAHGQAKNDFVVGLECDIKEKISQLRSNDFSQLQCAALRDVLLGLVELDDTKRMSLHTAIQTLGATEKRQQKPEVSPAPETTVATSLPSRVLEVWILGASFVGKSRLMSAFTGAQYAPVTVGVNSTWRNVRPGMPKGFHVRLWDTAGQRIFRNSMAGLTTQDAFVALVYDVTVRESYDEVRDIYMQLRQRGRLATCVVVANKIDLTEQRDVTYQEGLEMAESIGAEGYFETSAQSGDGVQELFLSVFQIADRLDQIITVSAQLTEGTNSPRQRRMCC